MTKYKDGFSLRLPKELLDLRDDYKKKGIPCVLTDTLNLLTLSVSVKEPKSILEIGTAAGISGISMLLVSPQAKLTTIERDEDAFNESKKNFYKFGVADRVRQYLADAGDVIGFTEKKFDFIFLDGSKARYYDYLFDLKRTLADGGVLFADNVLFRGYVDGGVGFGHGDNTIVRNMRGFLDDVLGDETFISNVFEIGDGVLVAKKIK